MVTPANPYSLFQETKLQSVSRGEPCFLLSGCENATHLLVILFPQLGDFDSLEYAWWLQRSRCELEALNVTVRAVGIGNLASGQRFCHFTEFPEENLLVDPKASLHQQLGLYTGLFLNIPGLSAPQQAWVNLLLMCAGIGSPGTLKEVLRGYTGDRAAPQLIGDDEVIKAPPLPPLQGSFFNGAGGNGFQRPFELATLRLRNMGEVLSHWGTYVPDASYLTQRGGTFLFNPERELIYEWRDRAILGFAENMSSPLDFLRTRLSAETVTA
ncbi:hypothetical protein PCC7418_0764 [Halothece sp. PCC 7418]|uniref:peroxiredoxin-like family protein n=1 Tax=Halothece sp. (strain PCC 7418) TaxID=65093 RepID=UPI0002A0773B|nr:peroxiredoxin-like family protein [Halothece sp. PCC 7418]AFZ42983.1 hypothetical protein PCC7418_0764 [Halothece sp. PCC 7418]